MCVDHYSLMSGVFWAALAALKNLREDMGAAHPLGFEFLSAHRQKSQKKAEQLDEKQGYQAHFHSLFFSKNL